MGHPLETTIYFQGYGNSPGDGTKKLTKRTFYLNLYTTNPDGSFGNKINELPLTVQLPETTDLSNRVATRVDLSQYNLFTDGIFIQIGDTNPAHYHNKLRYLPVGYREEGAHEYRRREDTKSSESLSPEYRPGQFKLRFKMKLLTDQKKTKH